MVDRITYGRSPERMKELFNALETEYAKQPWLSPKELVHLLPMSRTYYVTSLQYYGYTFRTFREHIIKKHWQRKTED